MIRTHVQGQWPGEPLCGDRAPDSSGTVTTDTDYAQADCPECIAAIGGNVCVCGAPFIPNECGASTLFCSDACATLTTGVLL